MGIRRGRARALPNGTVGIALVWGPALWALQRSDAGYAKLRHDLGPGRCRTPRSMSGAAVLAEKSSLRSNIDQAIASLTADGTIQSILDGDKFPAAAVK